MTPDTPLPRQLNLGCGFDKRDGWLNVDNFAECAPDMMVDIEATPWPLPTDQFDTVLLKHVLEHVGADFGTFKRVMQELYRVTAPNGLIEIHVPHFRHDTYWSDPTHVRAFTHLTFEMMSKRRNLEWVEKRANYTMLALMMNVDFELEKAVLQYAPEWSQLLDRGEITQDQIRFAAAHQWNVARELRFTLRCVKDQPSA